MSSDGPCEQNDWTCPDCGQLVKYNPLFEKAGPCGGPRKQLDEFYDKDVNVRHGVGGLKYDDSKPRTDLLPGGALLEVARVMGHGAKTYGEHNWKNVRPRSRYIGAILRHIWAFTEGETHDKESGLHHLYHAACCALFLAQFAHEGEI